jgi:hypothetical protein
MDLLTQEEVRELVGERSQPQAERTANRWGNEHGYWVVMGEKVPVERPQRTQHQCVIESAFSIVERVCKT